MSTDRLLATLLRYLQSAPHQQDTRRLLGTAASLLTSLNNPLNITLLTSQLLSAPALWPHPNALTSSLTFMTLFHSAAIKCHERETTNLESQQSHMSIRPHVESHLPLHDWIQAVLNGADQHSPPDHHLLAIAGLIVGLATRDHDFMSTNVAFTLRSAFVKAVNLALSETPAGHDFAHGNICLALNHAFTHLSDIERSTLDYDRLLPVLMTSTFHSPHGLRSGYFLGAADADLHQVSNQQFNWPSDSPSYQQIESILKSPLISSLGPLSRLIAHTIDHVKDPWLVQSAVEDLSDFSKRLGTQWRQNKLSEIDASEETIFLHEEARKNTVPTLWKLLRSTLFAIVIILRSASGRVVGNAALAAHSNAPHTAQAILHSLRSLSFVFSRMGNVSFSQYTFTYLTSIDILANYPNQSATFLDSIAPSELGHIPSHPLERNLDLFFLNTAEHFALVLSSRQNEDLLLAAASPYLITAGNPNLLPIFEAAHSVTLSVFSAPQNVDLTAKHLPFYVDALFQVFPHNLSARQFRLAFKNLIRVVSPPSRIAITQPMLAATLLDLVHERAIHAPDTPLPASYAPLSINSPELESAPQSPVPDLSEKAVLILTLIDAFPCLSLALLEEWLPLTATATQMVTDSAMREHCKKHFWEVLVGGEMDPERSQICVRWWTSRGGRESLIYGDNMPDDEYVMSGGLGEEEKVMAKL
ncbi:peroxin-8 Pex8-penicillium chrysogenum, partial [Aureobasidium melanogenum]